MIRLTGSRIRWALAVGAAAVLLILAWRWWPHFVRPVNAQQATSGGAGPNTARAADGPLRVKVVRPKVEPFRHTTKQPAHVEPFEKTDVYAKAAGYLGRLGSALGRDGALGPGGEPLLGPDEKRRDLDIGDRVEKGQVLAELHIPEMIAELELKKAAHLQAIADVKKQQADVDYYAADLRRHEQLGQGGGISADLVDVKRRQYAAAAAAKESAQARVEVARREVEHQQALVDYAKVKAPYAGIITRRMVDNGDFVQSAATGKAEPLFTIVRVDRLRVVTDIPEADAKWVKLGQHAALTIDGGQKQIYQGEVVRSTDVLDPQGHKLRIEVELKDAAPPPRPGAYGWVEITFADHANALFVPASCLHHDGDKVYVLCGESGTARRHDVKLGYYDGARAQITAGLKPDEAVILPVQEAIEEGRAIEVAN